MPLSRKRFVVGKHKRVTLIGPVSPLRGGIAQHTESLRAAMAERADLLTLSYRRLYPRWLFPGKSMLEPGFSAPPGRDEERVVNFDIDALDPRTWHGAVRAVHDHDSDLVVMPWWTAALAGPTTVIARGCRREGIPITFLCHNVVDHEAAWWKRRLARHVLQLGSRFVVASAAEALRLQKMMPDADIVVHPHPVYRHMPPATRPLPRRAARELLFFGIIRPYKGLDILIEALASMPDSDWHLTIAGEPWQDLGELRARVSSIGVEDRVEWIDEYVPDELAAALFGRADALVLPYRHATGCGVLALALGYGKAVVASDVPGLREQVVHGETGWLVSPGDHAALAAAMAGIHSVSSTALTSAVQTLARQWSWDSLAEAVLAA